MRRTVLTLSAAQPRDEITVTMPDGSERKGKAWETSPMDVAKEVSKSLSERIVIAKVRWQLFAAHQRLLTAAIGRRRSVGSRSALGEGVQT